MRHEACFFFLLLCRLINLNVYLSIHIGEKNIFDLRLNKRWNEQSMRWFETPASSLWRRGNGKLVSLTISLHNPVRRILASKYHKESNRRIYVSVSWVTIGSDNGCRLKNDDQCVFLINTPLDLHMTHPNDQCMVSTLSSWVAPVFVEATNSGARRGPVITELTSCQLSDMRSAYVGTRWSILSCEICPIYMSYDTLLTHAAKCQC